MYLNLLICVFNFGAIIKLPLSTEYSIYIDENSVHRITFIHVQSYQT